MTLGLSWMQVYGSGATSAAVATVAGGAAAAVFLALWRTVLVRTPQGLYLLIVFAVRLFLVFILAYAIRVPRRERVGLQNQSLHG